MVLCDVQWSNAESCGYGVCKNYTVHLGEEEYFMGPLGNDVFQCSPMPWVTYTHISHTNSGKKDNATPLFDWGKYYVKDGRIMMPISVQAHHSFVDGIHIGEYVDLLEKYLASF